MQFFHTGAKTFRGIQTDPYSCLGGFVSSTILPNGKMNALFNEISRYSDELGGYEVRGIALMNTTNAVVNGPVNLWFDYPSSGQETFAIPFAELSSQFSVSGVDGVDVFWIIPDSGLSNQLELLKTRIFDGLVRVGDKLTLILEDSSTSSEVTLYVKEVVRESNSHKIIFTAPDYTAIGLDYNTIAVFDNSSTYQFTSLNLTNRARFEISPVSLIDGQKMEIINDIKSLPYVGTFYEPRGEGNKILLANSIPVNGGIGLWFKKTILMPNPLDSVPDEELESYLASLSKQEVISVSVEYP